MRGPGRWGGSRRVAGRSWVAQRGRRGRGWRIPDFPWRADGTGTRMRRVMKAFRCQSRPKDRFVGARSGALLVVATWMMTGLWASAVAAEVRGAGGLAEPGRTPESVEASGLVTNRFTIRGMKCKDCARGLAAELRLTPGVVRSGVSFDDREAWVVADSRRLTLKALVKVIEEAGFQGKPLAAGAGRGVAGKGGRP